MMYDSWDIEHDKHNFFSFWIVFCHFTYHFTQVYHNWPFCYLRLFFALTASTMEISKKINKKKKKRLEISSFYTSVEKSYQKSWSYAVLFLIYGVSQMQLLFLILGYFLPFYSHNSLKNKLRKKWKETPGDIIILHNCTKNHDHMLYYSWDMARDTCKCYFSFWAIFCPIPPPLPP